MITVAIVGGGCAGICAARACIQNGLVPTIFEQRQSLGGIWTENTSDQTPIFDNLTTNTASFDTCISDVPPLRPGPSPSSPPHENLCLTRHEFAQYIHAILDATPSLRDTSLLDTTVLSIRFDSDQPHITYRTRGVEASRTFHKVIIASGMHHTPYIPDAFPGIDSFPGHIAHVSEYKRPSQYKGRVLVVGGSVSGCEVAGDLAAGPNGPHHVTLCSRKMRFLVAKQKERRMLRAVTATRFQNLRTLAATLTDDIFMEEMQSIVHSFTRNQDFNAPPPDGPIKRPFEPNWVPVSSKLLEASNNHSMSWKISKITRFDPNGFVHFQDGSQHQFDTVLFATGYRLQLPFLDNHTKSIIGMTQNSNHLSLYKFTIHPDLPHLGFVGIYPPTGSILPPFESQARMLAHLFANPHHIPPPPVQHADIAAWNVRKSRPDFMTVISGIEIMDPMAKLGRFEIDLSVYPHLTKALLFAPMVPAQFRIFGPTASPHPMHHFLAQIEAAGFVPGDNTVSKAQLAELERVCDALEGSHDAPKGLRKAFEYLRSVNC